MWATKKVLKRRKNKQTWGLNDKCCRSISHICGTWGGGTRGGGYRQSASVLKNKGPTSIYTVDTGTWKSLVGVTQHCRYSHHSLLSPSFWVQRVTSFVLLFVVFLFHILKSDAEQVQSLYSPLIILILLTRPPEKQRVRKWNSVIFIIFKITHHKSVQL